MSEVCLQIADVLPGRLTFAAVKSYALFKRSKQAAQCVCFSIDDDLVRSHLSVVIILCILHAEKITSPALGYLSCQNSTEDVITVIN